MSESIVIANSTIRQQDGLYCLNDLHRASGGKAKSQPSYFLRTQQTQDLVNKINHSANMQSTPPPEDGCEVNIDFCLNMVFNIDSTLNKRCD